MMTGRGLLFGSLDGMELGINEDKLTGKDNGMELGLRKASFWICLASCSMAILHHR